MAGNAAPRHGSIVGPDGKIVDEPLLLGSGEREFSGDDLAEIYPFDETNPRSMINKVPPWIKKRMLNPTVKELLQKPEEELNELVKPTLTIKRLRTSFWYEYERIHRNYGRVVNKETTLSVQRMCTGICTADYFQSYVMRNDYLLAYVLRPPLNYDMAMNEALTQGLGRLREILEFPLYQKKFNKDGLPVCDKHTGKQVQIPDVPVANLMLKTVAFLDLRIKGAIPQTINQQVKSVSYNLNQNQNHNTPASGRIEDKLMTIEDLDAKIALLSVEANKLVSDPRFDQKEINYLNKQSNEGIEKHAEKNGYGELSDDVVDIPPAQMNTL